MAAEDILQHQHHYLFPSRPLFVIPSASGQNNESMIPRSRCVLKPRTPWQPCERYVHIAHQRRSALASCCTYSVLLATPPFCRPSFPESEMLDIYWPVFLFHFSLPALQYPSPLHGHRWITRPGLAQLTESRRSSENTPLPSYSDGLSAGYPLGSLSDTMGDWMRWGTGGAGVGGRRVGRR